MNQITDGEKAVIDSNMKLQQEVRRLQDELSNAREQRNSIKETMDAIITAFFRNGATSPNVTAECFEAGVTYEIVQNNGFFTIKRTEEEEEREGGLKEWRINAGSRGRMKSLRR